MFRRLLFLGIGLAAALWTLATPGQLQAQHGRGGAIRGATVSSSGLRHDFNRTSFSNGFGGFDRRFNSSGFCSFNPGFDRGFSGFGFGTSVDPRFFSPGLSGLGPVLAPPFFPATDRFGRPLIFPRSSGF